MSSSGFGRHLRWIIPIGMGVSLLLFWPALSFEFLSYDDNYFIRNNHNVNEGISWVSLRWAATANLLSVDRLAEYWMPLTQFSRLLDVQIFGLNGGLHHLQSILLHGLNAALVFKLLFELTKAPMRSGAVALLFLLHPLNVEVVCWVALRKDVLSATFCLLTLIAYSRYRLHGVSRNYLFALGYYMAALASKPSAMSLPLALILLDVWPLQRLSIRPIVPRVWIEAVADKLPFALLAFLVGALTFIGQTEAGAAASQFDTTMFQRLGATVVGMIDYLRRLVVPLDLCILYPRRSLDLLDLHAVWWGAAALLALSAAWAVLALKGRKAGLVGWIWFLGLLLPVTGLVAFGRQATADRYLYLPLIGLLFGLVWTIADARQAAARLFPKFPGLSRNAAVVATLLGLVVLTVISRQQTMTWQNGFTVWEHAMQVQEEHGFAMQMLGGDHFVRDRPKVGENYLRASIKLEPQNGERMAKLGTMLTSYGDPAMAIRFLDDAIRLRPREIKLHVALVICLQKLGRAAEVTRATIRLQLIRIEAFVQQGLVFMEKGDGGLAREQFEQAWSALAEALRDRPETQFFRKDTTFWKSVRREMGRLAPGVSEYDAAWCAAAVEYLSQNPEAIAAFEQLAKRFPKEADPHWRLAICHQMAGRTEEARKEANAARAAESPSAEGEAEWERGPRRKTPDPAPAAADSSSAKSST